MCVCVLINIRWLNANIMSADVLVSKRTGKRASVGALETAKKREDALWRRNGERG